MKLHLLTEKEEEFLRYLWDLDCIGVCGSVFIEVWLNPDNFEYQMLWLWETPIVLRESIDES